MRSRGEDSRPASLNGALHGRPRHLGAAVCVSRQETESVGEPVFILGTEGLENVSTENIPVSFWI